LIQPPANIIGIDARAAAEVPAGRGRLVRELLRALAARKDDNHRYVLYARTRWDDAALEAHTEAGDHVSAWAASGAVAGPRFRWQLIDAPDRLWHLLAARAANRECDVFLSSNSYLTARFLRIPNVLVVYDLITFEPSMRPNRRSTVIERLTLAGAVRRSAAFIAISQATADALVARYPAARSRTVVALLGVAPALNDRLESAEAAALPEPGFVLSVGTLEPRKNLPRLVAAYRCLDRATQDAHPLVVVGARGWQTGETLDRLHELGDRCVMLGHVSDSALAELYRRCAVFCYPSLGEGFGLPILEAMAAGAAVLTSDVSSLPEVGGDAVEYADPRDIESIARALQRLLAAPERRAQLRELAIVRSRRFSWERFARITLDATDRVAGGA
jgi:alpha-1,3-rhamnosyl/mannosyltransferase